MRPSPRSGHPAGGGLGQEVRPFEVRGDQLVEALFGGFEKVAALARRHAGVIDQDVERVEALPRERDQRLAILVRGESHWKISAPVCACSSSAASRRPR